MDDLDDLLDEIEKSFETPTNVKKVTKCSKSKVFNNVVKQSSLDDDINEILKETQPSNFFNQSVKQTKLKKPVQHKSTTLKCIQIYLGGSRSEKGACTVKQIRTCDNLRCTSCDFKVLQVDDHVWSKDTNYLFLRNNMPDLHRLSSNLLYEKGYRAYACQCSWRSVTKQQLKCHQLKWVCAKH